jgi:hypothetical protein
MALLLARLRLLHLYRGPVEGQIMNIRILAITIFVLTLLALASGSPPAATRSGTSGLRPAAGDVIEITSGFRILYPPGTELVRHEWDVELDYAVPDVQAVFDHYEAVLTGQGFVRTSYDPEGDEIEARYSRGNIDASLEVELDDGGTRVDLDLDDPSAGTVTDSFTLTGFAGIEIPFFDAGITDIEWEFAVRHATTDHESVFDHYDAELESLGWTRTELESDRGGIEADYSKSGVRLELEVDREDGHTRAEWELNTRRLYE